MKGVGKWGDIALRLSTPDDAVHIAPRLRPWDIIECLAFGQAPLDMLIRPFYHGLGPITRTLEVGGEPAAMLGYSPEDDGTALIWMLGTHKLEEMHWSSLRMFRQELHAGIPDRYRNLWNWVPERYELTHKWLRWMGFDISGEFMDIRGIRFVKFVMSR